MLRNRSRAVTTLMADHQSQSQQQKNCNKTPLIQSFFGSPRLMFKSFFSETDHQSSSTMSSPTSILTPFCNNPFSSYQETPINPKSPKLNSSLNYNEAIGLAFINTVKDDDNNNTTKQSNSCSSSPERSTKNNNKMVLFGTELRIQIPPLSPTGSTKSENFPVDQSTKISTGCLSVSDMELSEDYTCIISHDGPDPKKTHIFDNCIVETYLCLSDQEDNKLPESDYYYTKEKSFLSFCHTCKKNLEQNDDIYIYRGEKAFCSQECRYQEMLLDEEKL